MKKMTTMMRGLWWATVAIILLSPGVFAADCPSDITAVTTKDPQVSEEILGYQVKPLTKCELEVEAQAWNQLLKEKVDEISHAQIAIAYKKEGVTKTSAANADVQKEIKAAKVKAKEEGEKLDKGNSAEADKSVKIALVKHMTDLQAERTALIDRIHIVLKDLKAKGGDITEYEVYIKAVSGVKIDVTDASAAWTGVIGWLKSAEGGVRWGFNFLKFILIICATYVIAVFAGKATHRTLSRSQNLSVMLKGFIALSVRRLFLLIGFFIGLSALEFELGPVLAMIGAAGFVVAFALQNSLSNFASGLLTLFYRPFDIGDLINVAGTLGEVESMNLLSTQLRTPDNQLVTVPNNAIWGDTIVNVTGISHRRIDLMFGIGYSDDIDKAQAILEDIVSKHERVLKNPEPTVKLHELADSSVNFVCRPWVKPEDYWDVYWDVTREVKRRFDAEGVSIPFPQQDVHLYSTETSN